MKIRILYEAGGIAIEEEHKGVAAASYKPDENCLLLLVPDGGDIRYERSRIIRWQMLDDDGEGLKCKQ